MKRLFSLVMALCMMMSMAAFAEQSVVMQNELPPMLVTEVNAAGETVVAKIFDNAGNLIKEVLYEEALSLVDVHHRQDENGEISVIRLTAVYEDIMAQIHHGNVECELHEHELKVDINTILASLGLELDSHDLVMYELFDVELIDAELAALLVDGNYMELTLQVDENQPLPLITMFTADGSEWRVLPTTNVGEKQFKVQLDANGTLALLADGHGIMNIGGEDSQIVLPGDQGEGNDNFTPSVTGKPAPEVVPVVDADGNTYIGIIHGADGEPEMKVEDNNYIQITAVAERDYVGDIQTHEHLEWAYDSILAAEDVGDLYTTHGDDVKPEDEHATLADALDAVLAEMGLGITHDRLVVKDLFEVSAYGDYLHALYDEDHYLEITFYTKIADSTPIIVIHSKDSVHWHVHPIDEYIVHEDGKVTLKMYDLGAVAFLVEAVEEINAETAVQSPV